jgi:hypothetical protein
MLLMVFSFCLLVSCKKSKQPSKRPEIDENRVFLKLDGQSWETGDVQGGIYRTSDDSNSKYIFIHAYRGSESVYLYLNRPFSTGTKLLNENTIMYPYTANPKDHGFFHRYVSGSINDFWTTNSIDTGHCTITFIDTTTNRIKGIFSFRCRSDKTGEVITISEGYFSKMLR